jgi:hypothetical protein
MVAQRRGVRSVVAVLAVLAAGCGARGGGPGIVEPQDVPAAGVDRGGAMDAGTPPTDLGGPADLGPAPDRGTVVPVDVAGCVPSGAETTAAACGDRVDNDCDGFLDCTDPDCDRVCRPPPVDAGGPADAGCVRAGDEGTNAACANGVDDDCDGYTDCVDFSCSMSAAVTVCPRDAGPPDTGCVRTGAEDNPAACADRVDNDCDGFVDCNDFNCSRTAAVTVCARDGGAIDAGPRDAGPRDAGRRDVGACDATGTEATNAACADGVDNDCDGYVDCNDFNCSRTATVTVCRDAGP